MTLSACRTEATGLGAQVFRDAGNELAILMTRDAANLPDRAGPEQVIALLEGRARLVCPDETHDLAAGDGILIPADTPCRWEVIEPALFYRVARL